jgi:histone acetyltransferase (RNA polymerase elongator complex component)
MDLEDLVPDISNTNYDRETLIKMINDILAIENPTEDLVVQEIYSFRKKYKSTPSKKNLLNVYRQLCKEKNIPYNTIYEKLLRTCPARSQSGVLVVAVVMSAYPNGKAFTCAYDCYYCPQEPGQPRSYSIKEPGVARANRNNFDPMMQMYDRLDTYYRNGHTIDKLEIIVLGGTFCSYDEDYQYNFIKQLYYAANTYFDETKRPAYENIEDEVTKNENAKVHIIGLTLETRPDTICAKEMIKFRRMGVTRLQLGVQHIDDDVLRRVNRQCPTIKTIRGIKMLKNNCFKVDIHLMPDLPKPYVPGSDPDQYPKVTPEWEDIDWSVDMYERDKRMFDMVISSQDFQVDQWKIYPFSVVPHSEMKRQFDEGLHKSYVDTIMPDGKNQLEHLMYEVLPQVPIWIRINRLQRDIPACDIVGGNSVENFRQIVEEALIKKNTPCRCIRCREVKGKNVDYSNAQYFCTQYKSSDGEEYFLSFENKERTTIYGFLRLRLSNEVGLGMNDDDIVFDELIDCALIRELHVYGDVVGAHKDTTESSSQHRGFGSQLMDKAFQIAAENGYAKIAVISGAGVKGYYKKKHGFEEGKYFLVKKIEIDKYNHFDQYLFWYIFAVCALVSLWFFKDSKIFCSLVSSMQNINSSVTYFESI